MRKIKNTDEAVVGIVVAILLIGLTITVISIIQTIYVPQWLEQREADHMHTVSYQFSQLKNTLDILSVVEQKNSISSYITLGITDIPIFGSGRTFDTLEILSDVCNLKVINGSDSLSFSLGTIKFSSGNSFFVDQSYIYEAGALILSQSSANILNGKPFFSLSNYTNISLSIINISGADEKISVTGYGTYLLYMEFLNSTKYTIKNVKNINITTNYKNAWRLFFNSNNLKYSGLTYEIKEIDNGITVEFNNSLCNLFLNFIEISVQIAPGWIE
jgi:hypothetical protein